MLMPRSRLQVLPRLIRIAKSPRCVLPPGRLPDLHEVGDLGSGEDVMTSGKSLIGAVLVLGVALSACAPTGPQGAYVNGYYDDPGYYDPGYFNEFGFVDLDRDHEGRHRHHRDGDHDRDRDGGDRYGMRGVDDARGGASIPGGPAVVASPSLAPRSAIGGEHSFAGERGGRR